MRNKPSNQKGVTLVELLLVISIAALVVGAAVAVWLQLDSVSARNSDYTVAYAQVQNAGDEFSRDAVQITVAPKFGEPPEYVGDEGFPVTLLWGDYGVDPPNHWVRYTLDGASGELRREGTEGGLVVVAQHIDSTKTNCTWDEETLTLKITAEVGERIASRTYEVEPRVFFE